MIVERGRQATLVDEATQTIIDPSADQCIHFSQLSCSVFRFYLLTITRYDI